MTLDLASEVADVLAVDPDEFRERAEADAEVVKSELHAGTFDNHQSIVGLEYEFYAVDAGRWAGEEDPGYALARVPRRLLGLIGFEKELGLHNAEMCTSPQPMNPHGLRAQEAEVCARLQAAQECTGTESVQLVSDGMWTIPPAGETARGYLTDSVEVDGIRIAANMTDSARYHAMANGPRAGVPRRIEAPHVSLEANTVMPESLITSIQPHYQVHQAETLPEYFNYALRIAGPLLALGVNSPFFPPDLYDDVPPRRILDDSWHENRIAVFESVLNTDDAEKVRFPRDLETIDEAVDRVARDPTMVPMKAQEGNRFDDRFATLRLKHGTYWRWVRPVFDGADRSSANARIEFRPIAAQPTVRDSIAFLATIAGLMESLPRQEHPVQLLPWDAAEENFYAAMRDGIHAEQRWITNDGQETTTTAVMYDELFEYAADGLRLVGCSPEQIDGYLAPLRVRVSEQTTPADWKRRSVERRLDGGADLTAAIEEMQREYVTRQSETLLDGSFADWLR